jgi:hypothetical protein
MNLRVPEILRGRRTAALVQVLPVARILLLTTPTQRIMPTNGIFFCLYLNVDTTMSLFICVGSYVRRLPQLLVDTNNNNIRSVRSLLRLRGASTGVPMR